MTTIDQPTAVPLSECTWCGREFDEEELESPSLNHEGEPICDECYTSEFQFDCSECLSSEDNTVKDAIGALMVVYDSESAGVPAGLYRITAHPFYCSDMLSMWFFKDAIERVGDGPTGNNDFDYPCGFLCRECGEKLLKEAQL